MLKVSKFSATLMIVVFLFSVYAFLPNVIKMPKFLPQIGSKINFGLDISGGTHLLLKVNTQEYIKTKLKRNTNDIIKAIREKGILYSGFGVNDTGLHIKINDQDGEKLKSIVHKIDGRFVVSKVQSGTYSISYGENEIKEIKADLIERSIEIIRKRIDFSGTKEIDLYKQGLESIVLEVPGVNEPEKIKALINTSAKLTFHLLHPVTPMLNSAMDIGELSNQGYLIMPSYNKNSGKESDKSIFVVSSNIEVDGSTLVDAKAVINDEGPVVLFKFDTKGARDFANITAANIGKPLAIVLDGQVISTPMIRSQIGGGSGIISGDFSIDDVKNLSLLLRSGALPATLDVVEEGIVGPSLGSEFLSSGIKAFFLSLLFVSLFVIFRYKKLAPIAIISIIYNSVLILGIFSMLGITLTIAGIAGLTLTIGMAVDANVLIFEKILEDTNSLKTSSENAAAKSKKLFQSISASFSSAFSAILDSNITTLIAAFMIFAFTFGSIKGFAVSLSIGVLCSLYSCVSVTKTLTSLFFKKQ